MICRTCVLDERYPGIQFDEDGACIFCKRAGKAEFRASQKRQMEKKFLDLIASVRGTSAYDCIVAYSGGKDSTYTLHLLKHIYGLNILAFTFDNWFQSKRAQENIKNVVKRMDIAHLTVRPEFGSFKRIMVAAVSDDLFSIKALERASTICTTCISLLRFIGFAMAIEKHIPLAVFGFSPGQAPTSTGVFKTNPAMLMKMQQVILSPLVARLGKDVQRFFLEDRHVRVPEAFPFAVNPLAFVEYDEKAIYETIGQYGWEKPLDTDPNSTNCLLNAYANQQHIDRFGYNPYAYEIAELVRAGAISREEGMARLAEPPDIRQVAMVKKELGLL